MSAAAYETFRQVRRPIPSSDYRQPKYRWVLVSPDRLDWIASTNNESEGLPAFVRMAELGAASEIIEVVE